ncbi:MAG: hypothetical protein HY236_13915 [Acidobacteria bacterium]|nr:hypothetical protein [Acidobacteriota bacterium]
MLHLRTAMAAARSFSGVAARFWRILRTLFLEVVGLVFLVLSGWGGLWLIRTYRSFNGDGEVLFKMLVVAVFVVMMCFFGISSFWRARRLSRTR